MTIPKKPPAPAKAVPVKDMAPAPHPPAPSPQQRVDTLVAREQLARQQRLLAAMEQAADALRELLALQQRQLEETIAIRHAVEKSARAVVAPVRSPALDPSGFKARLLGPDSPQGGSALSTSPIESHVS